MIDLLADSTLTDSLKWELVAWVCGALMSVPFAVKNCIAIWQMLRAGDRLINPSDYITRPEFEAHCRTEEQTANELKDIRRTLTTMGEDIAYMRGRSHLTP